MAMTKRQKQLAGMATVGIVAIGLLVSGVAGAAEPPEPDGKNGKKNGYIGPDPNRPDGKVPGDRKDAVPSPTRPDSIEPDDLWVSPDCDDVMVGEQWETATMQPAVEDWVSSGYGRPREFYNEELSQARVVREILGPYSPLCVEVMFWGDTYEREHPFPADGTFEEQQAYNTAMIAAMTAMTAKYPQLVDLAAKIDLATMQRAEREWPGEEFPNLGEAVS